MALERKIPFTGALHNRLLVEKRVLHMHAVQLLSFGCICAVAGANRLPASPLGQFSTATREYHETTRFAKFVAWEPARDLLILGAFWTADSQNFSLMYRFGEVP